jgi:phosphocarrier protein HPr
VPVPELKNSIRPEAIVVIRNIKGLHARASAKFVKCAECYTANITVTRDGQKVGGTSIMGLMMLAAGPGSELHITAEGPQGPAALAALVALVEAGFDEDCVGDG